MKIKSITLLRAGAVITIHDPKVVINRDEIHILNRDNIKIMTITEQNSIRLELDMEIE